LSQNRTLLERSLRGVWHPCTQTKAHETLPLVLISHGRGVWLHDFDGNRYLDATSSWCVNLFAHAGHAQKSRFVCLEGRYHGETLGTPSVSDVALFRDVYAPLLNNVARVPSPDWRRAGAAFDRYSVHLIADEVAVSFGRTGSFCACEQAGITPDFLCLSKGISGGFLPLSVVMTSQTVYDAFHDDELTRAFLHSHSFTGNPLAAHPRVCGFRNTGMIWAFDVDTADPRFGRRFYEAVLSHGVLLRPLGRTVYFVPPYVIERDEMALLVRGALAALEQSIG
jgi:adenosylmethionine-8-amino-7-oxononanoate aminotransferase